MRASLFVTLLALAGCPTSPDSDGPSLCEALQDDFDAGDTACLSEELLTECWDLDAECPNGVAVLESCPVQFECG